MTCKQTTTTTGCTEGTTRTVTCPKDGKQVTQKCISGSWVNQQACKGEVMIVGMAIPVWMISVFVIIAFVIFARKK